MPPSVATACRRLLAKDAADRPTLAEVARILSIHLDTTALPPVPGGTAAPRLFGRAELLHDVQRALEDTRVVALVGPTGFGKTALLESLCAEAEQVFVGRGRPTDRVAFNAIDGAVDELTTALAGRATLSEGLVAAASKAAPTFPSLGQLVGLDPAKERTRAALRAQMFGDRTTQAPSRREAFAALCRMFELLGPATLAVDDLQWADDDSLAALDALVRDGPPALRIVVALRDDVAAPGAQAWLDGVGGRRIAVPPLATEATRSVIRRAVQAADGDVTDADVDRAAAACDGVPFLAEQAGRALASGRRDPIAMQIETLRRGERRLLTLLYVADQWTAATELASLRDVSLGDVDDALVQLVGLGLVRLGGARPHSRADLYHDTVRRDLSDVLSGDEIRSGHQAFTAMEGLAPVRRVRHLVGAGRTDEAALLARAVADDAVARGAFALGADMYDVALSRRTDDHASLLAARSHALERAGRYAAAATSWRELASVADPAEREDALVHEAYALLACNRVGDGYARLDEILHERGQAPTGTMGWRGYRALMRFLVGPRRRRVRRADDMSSSADAARDVRLGTVVLILDPPTGLSLLQRAQRAYDDVGDAEQSAWCDYVFAHFAQYMSAAPVGPTGLETRYRDAADASLGGRTPSRSEVAGLPHLLDGMTALREGRWDQALCHFSDSIATMESSARGSFEAMAARTFRAETLFFQQRFNEVDTELAELRAVIADCGGNVMQTHVAFMDLGLHIFRGEYEAAEEIYAEIDPMLPADRPTIQRTSFVLHHFWIRLYRDDPAAARRDLAVELKAARRFRLLESLFGGIYSGLAALVEASALRAGDRAASMRRLRRFCAARGKWSSDRRRHLASRSRLRRRRRRAP